MMKTNNKEIQMMQQVLLLWQERVEELELVLKLEE